MFFKEKLNKKLEELDKVNNELKLAKEKLEKYKKEALEIKDYIDSKFLEEYKDSENLIDITNCYIIRRRGYNRFNVALREEINQDSGLYSNLSGFIHNSIFRYYDLLYLEDGEPGFLCAYRSIYDDTGWHGKRNFGQKPAFEKHILEVFPELKFFSDSMVPEECLKKAYYEVNNLGSINKSKVLIKKKQ